MTSGRGDRSAPESCVTAPSDGGCAAQRDLDRASSPAEHLAHNTNAYTAWISLVVAVTIQDYS